jgi:16S rRNA (uracil1498-N3)-methyltransferase
MRRFYVNPSMIQADLAYLSASDSWHVTTVLRLKAGSRILLFDGSGVEYPAEIVTATPDRVSVLLLDRVVAQPNPTGQITVAQGFLKEKKMDGLIRSFTELGIHRFISFFAERSISRPSEHRLNARVERWNIISRESMKQCRRSSFPDITAASTLNDVIAQSSGADLKIVFWEKATDSISHLPRGANDDYPWDIFVIVGPEGGLTEREVETAASAGFRVLSLGPRILRAETAFLASCVLAQYLWGDLGISPGDLIPS